MQLQFDFPSNLNADKFIDLLSSQASIELTGRHYTLSTYYDTFDWRLYRNDNACEMVRSKSTSLLSLKHLKKDTLIASTELKDVPAFSHQFTSDIIRNHLAPLLEMRALLPVCTLDYECVYLNVLNSDNKTVLRLVIQQHELFNSRLILQPIKGYDKSAEHIITLITKEFDCIPAKQLTLLIALKLQGRKPNDYSSKLSLNLDPYMRADIAVKHIYSHLLKAIKDNEQGTIADTDSEFLHDFRVAVRRTRSGISQLKGLIPDSTNAYFSEFFSWLGQVTGNTRDLDVYLLDFDTYKHSLPDSMQADIDPLYEFLLLKQKAAQKELAQHLRSAHYLTKISEWEQFLKEQAPTTVITPNAKLSIQELANQRILKSYKKVLRSGNEITEHSPSEALHDLRKLCKKLRYLLEFFQSLYPEEHIKAFIKNLKELQEVLGNFQDYAVQEHALKVFSVEMLNNNTHANTILAMGVLVQNLDKLRIEARNEFAERFTEFKHEDKQQAFEALLSKKIRPTTFNSSS